MRTDRAVTKMSSDRLSMRPIVNRITGALKTLPSLAVGNQAKCYLNFSAIALWIVRGLSLAD